MADTRTLAKALGQTAQSTNTIKPQLGDRPDVYTYLRTRYERVGVVEIALDVATRDVSTDSIWGVATWGVDDWDGTYANSMVVVRVINPGNTHNEAFNNDDFKNVATTADWAVTPGQCGFTTGEIAQSEIIALNNETYTSLTLDAKGASLANLSFKVRFNGINWETVTRGVSFTSSYPSTAGIEWQATASGTATLTSVKINYN